MKGNLTPISIVMCVVLCVSIVFGVGMFDRQENGSLLGWNPSSAYNTLISSSTNLSPNVISQQSSSEYSGILVPMTSTPNRMRSRAISALPREPKFDAAVASSYSCAPLYTTSSASYHSFGGGGYAGGANNTFVFNQFKMAKSSPIGMSVMPNLSYVPAVSSRVYSSAQMSGGAYSYPASSMEGIAPRGINGRRNAGVGFDDIWSDWLWGLHDDGDGTGAWMYDSGDNYYYNSSKLREAFAAWFSSNSSSFQGMTEEEAWLLFLEWFAPKDSDGNLLDTDHNFRFPISDGLGVLMVLALLYAFVIYLKLRSKKVA